MQLVDGKIVNLIPSLSRELLASASNKAWHATARIISDRVDVTLDRIQRKIG